MGDIKIKTNILPNEYKCDVQNEKMKKHREHINVRDVLESMQEDDPYDLDLEFKAQPQTSHKQGTLATMRCSFSCPESGGCGAGCKDK